MVRPNPSCLRVSRERQGGGDRLNSCAANPIMRVREGHTWHAADGYLVPKSEHTPNLDRFGLNSLMADSLALCTGSQCNQ